MLLGLLIGAAPLIGHNLAAKPGTDSWHVLHDLERAGGTGTFVQVSPGQRLAGTILVSLPAAIGGNTLCPPATTGADAALPPTVTLDRCTVVRGGWGLGYLALWVLAALSTTTMCWRAWRCARREGQASRAALMVGRYQARLALLGGTGLTLTLFAFSPAPARDPWGTSRYLVGLLPAVPALLAPLLTTLRGRGPAWVSGGLLLGTLFVTLLLGTVTTARAVPQAREVTRGQQALVESLLTHGSTRVYSGYWTCNWLMFRSDERVSCAVLEDDLRHGFDRDERYPALVHAGESPTYVFPLGSPSAAAFARSEGSAGRRYVDVIVAGYVIYAPASSAATVPQEKMAP